MQKNGLIQSKNFILISYIFFCGLFCSNAIIFSQGLLVGFFAGAIWYVPSIWIAIISFCVSIVNIYSGKFTMYFLVLLFITLISVMIRYLPYINDKYKILIYIISYIPAIFIFNITPLFHVLNCIVSIFVASLNNNISSGIYSSKDIEYFFNRCFPNCFMLFVIGIGSVSIIFWKFNVYIFLFSFLSLIYSKLSDEKTRIISMLFFTIAGYFSGAEYSLLYFMVFTAVSLSFSEWSKVIIGSTYIIGIFIVALFITYNNVDFYTSIFSSCIGMCAFLLVPYKKIKETTAKNKYASQKEIINRDRNKISIKIDELSQCFMKISNSYAELSKATLKDVDGIRHIADFTIKNMCKNCDKCHFCDNNELIRRAEFEFLALASIKKTKATILDVGDYVSKYCTRKVELLNTINKCASEVSSQMLIIEEKGKGKDEISRTYKKVACILHRLSTDASKQISFDIAAQVEISNALDKTDIFYRELFIYQNENKCICVEMFARSDDKNKILECIQSVFKSKFQISSLTKSKNTNCEYIVFVKSPRLQIDCANYTKSKNNNDPNGDTITILNLPEGRFVCAICDGMGSGEKAHDFSQKAINFIENLFSAGFVASDIISSVNSFMENCEYSSYATLDILEIDLYAERAFLYKIGSPDTYYFADKLHAISSKALPIGIMKEIKLEINTLLIEVGDRIVLASDGILDFMRHEIEIGLKSEYWINPQVFSKEIMHGCDKKMKYKKSDDRTIITIEIIENK